MCTVPRLRRIWRVTWHWLAPVSSAKRILARRTSRWGLVCRRAICSKQARCRAVSCTLGETVGVGIMAVGIGNSFRENWALFSSYDTMPPSVRILLPSTTRVLYAYVMQTFPRLFPALLAHRALGFCGD